MGLGGVSTFDPMDRVREIVHAAMSGRCPYCGWPISVVRAYVGDEPDVALAARVTFHEPPDHGHAPGCRAPVRVCPRCETAPCKLSAKYREDPEQRKLLSEVDENVNHR